MMDLRMKTNTKVQIIKSEKCKKIDYDLLGKKFEKVREDNERLAQFSKPDYKKMYDRFDI